MSTIISPTGWEITRNGQVLYAYSGIKVIAGTSEGMIDIESSGLDDLMVKMTCSADWEQIVQYLGFNVILDGATILYHQNDTSGGMDVQPPWHFEYVVPAQTSLKVNTYNDAASAGAMRSVMLVAYPLGVQDG